MHFILNAAVGATWTLLPCFVLTVGSNLLWGFGPIRAPFQGLWWFLAVGLVPGALGGVAIGLVRPTAARPTARRMALTAVAVAFAATLLAAALAAPLVQSLRFGKAMNTGGYLAWAPIYAVTLLPVTILPAMGAVRQIWNRAEPG